MITTALVLVFIAGFACWYDLYYGDGNIPEPNYPGIHLYPHCVYNSTRFRWHPDSPDKNWQEFQKTLLVADEVVPHVAGWVRQKHAEGKLIWAKESRPSYATYNYFRDELVIDRAMFSMNDGTKVSYLAHEWRHSRQNWTKPCRFILSAAFCRKENRDILEDDAYLYEHKVYLALFDPDVVSFFSGVRARRDNHGRLIPNSRRDVDPHSGNRREGNQEKDQKQAQTGP